MQDYFWGVMKNENKDILKSSWLVNYEKTCQQ